MDMMLRSIRQFRVSILILLTLVSCITVVACASSPSSTDTADSLPAEIVVATENDYPPFDFLKDGKHTGYNQALLDLVAEDIPFAIKQEILPFQGILTGLSSGRYDVSNSAVAILEDRLDTVTFTTPITEFTNYFVKRKGDTSVNAAEDFSGKSIGVQQGAITFQVVNEELNPTLEAAGKEVAKPIEYEAFGDAYQDLENGRVDAVVNNVVALSQLVKEKPDVFELGGQVGEKLYAGWVVKKGNQAVWEPLNAALLKLKESGKMAELQQEWLNISFDLPAEPRLPGDKAIPAS
ncbi:MAG: transporter substrate-binding domain-containing protein [Cyanobacteria bacterium P01_H01_bin.58]